MLLCCLENDRKPGALYMIAGDPVFYPASAVEIAGERFDGAKVLMIAGR